MDFHLQDHEEDDKVREINTPSNYNYLHFSSSSSSSSYGHSRLNTINFNTSHELQFIDLPLKSNNEEVLDGHIVDNNNQCNWYNTEKEHMFDKVVTPSDVGKLNRLVIPKQFAEKYLPLNSSTNEKGLILNFEDRSGKKWRFRYSYWNSSQSYVITKGWSRFVKDKKLNAGDIVSFKRCVGGKDHLYIDWRCRHSVHKPITTSLFRPLQFHNIIPSLVHEAVVPLQYLNLKPQFCSNYYNKQNQQQYGNNHFIRSSHEDDERGGDLPVVIESVNSFRSSSKRMRLFGVNMEYCPTEEESDVLTVGNKLNLGQNNIRCCKIQF